MVSANAAPAPQRIRFRYRVEYALLAGMSYFLRVLPYRAALGIAACLARFLFHVVGFRRKETLRRIALVFPEMDARKARWVAYRSLRNLAFNLVEMLRVRSFRVEDFDRMIPTLRKTVSNIRVLRSEGDGARHGVILALPHMGNWDLAGSACTLCGEPIFSVAGKQRNPLVNDLLGRLRAGHGMEIVERGGRAIVHILSRLRAGQVFAILPDSRNRLPDLEVPFLGGTANLARGMATFAHTTNSPILPVHMIRLGWTHFELVEGAPVYPDKTLDKAADIQRMTRLVIEQVESAIRAHPEQWFWYNKRWVLDPVESSATAVDSAPARTAST